MEFTLLKAATKFINEQEQDRKAMEILDQNLAAFGENKKLVCETAEEFLSQMFAKVKNQGTFTPEEADRFAAIAAALQLISMDDNRDTIMSKFKGDEQANLISIARYVSKPSMQPNQVDNHLVQIGKMNGRTLFNKLVAILNDPQSRDRPQLAADLQKLSNWYRQRIAGIGLDKTQPIPTTSTAPQKMAPMNQAQSGGASTGQTGVPAKTGGGGGGTPSGMGGGGTPSGMGG